MAVPSDTFEADCALGHHITDAIFDEVTEDAAFVTGHRGLVGAVDENRALFDGLRRRWPPPAQVRFAPVAATGDSWWDSPQLVRAAFPEMADVRGPTDEGAWDTGLGIDEIARTLRGIEEAWTAAGRRDASADEA